MTFPLRAAALHLVLLMVAVLAAPAQAAAPASPAAAGTISSVETPAKAKKKSSKVKYEKGSAESTAERDRRLYRECKGRPNAGACMGYAS